MFRQQVTRFSPHPTGRITVVDDVAPADLPRRAARPNASSLPQPASQPQPPGPNGSEWSLGPLQCKLQTDVRREHAAPPITTQPLQRNEVQEAISLMRIGPPRKEEFWNQPLSSRSNPLYRPVTGVVSNGGGGGAAAAAPVFHLSPDPVLSSDLVTALGSARQRIEHLGPLSALTPLHEPQAPLRPPQPSKKPDAMPGPMRAASLLTDVPVVDFSWEVVHAPTEENLRRLVAGAKHDAQHSTSHKRHEDPHLSQSRLAAHFGDHSPAWGDGPLRLVDPDSLPLKNPITYEALVAPFLQSRTRKVVKRKSKGPPGEDALKRQAEQLATTAKVTRGGSTTNPHVASSRNASMR